MGKKEAETGKKFISPDPPKKPRITSAQRGAILRIATSISGRILTPEETAPIELLNRRMAGLIIGALILLGRVARVLRRLPPPVRDWVMNITGFHPSLISLTDAQTQKKRGSKAMNRNVMGTVGLALALTTPFPVSAAEQPGRVKTTCPFTQKQVEEWERQKESASRAEAPEEPEPESSPSSQDSGRGTGGGSGGGSGGRPFAVSSTGGGRSSAPGGSSGRGSTSGRQNTGSRGSSGERQEESGYTEQVPTLPATQDIAMYSPQPEPERETQPEIGNIGWSTPDEEVWQWIVTGEIELPRTMQCGNQRVVTRNIVLSAINGGDRFYAFVKPGSQIDTPANWQALERYSQNVRDALVEYARNPESGACAVVEADNQYMRFLTSLQRAAHGLDMQNITPEGLPPELQAQWDRYMQEFNHIMEGVLDPSTVREQLRDWSWRFNNSDAYQAYVDALRPTQAASTGQPSQNLGTGRPSTGEGRTVFNLTFSGQAPSFEEAQAAADQVTGRAQSHGITTTQTYIQQIE